MLGAGGVEIAEGGKDVGAADDADEHRAFGFIEIGGRLAEVGAGGLLDAVAAGAEIDAVEVVGEDLVLFVAGFEAEGQGDFEQLAVDGFLADFEGVAGELHAQGGGSLGEIAVLHVADGGTGEAAEIDAAVVEEAGVLPGAEGIDEKVGDILAGDESAVVRAATAEFLAVAVEDDGPRWQVADLGEIEAAGLGEVKSGDHQADPAQDQAGPQRPAKQGPQPLRHPGEPGGGSTDGTPGGHGGGKGDWGIRKLRDSGFSLLRRGGL